MCGWAEYLRHYASFRVFAFFYFNYVIQHVCQIDLAIIKADMSPII